MCCGPGGVTTPAALDSPASCPGCWRSLASELLQKTLPPRLWTPLPWQISASPENAREQARTPAAAAEVAEPQQRPQLGTDPGQGTQAAAAKAAEPLEMS